MAGKILDADDPTPVPTPGAQKPAAEAGPTVKDSPPLSSKKFIIAYTAVLTSKILMLVGLLVLKDNVDAGSAFMWWWMMTLTVVDGFVVTGTVMGIAYVDRYVRVAQLVAQSPPSKT